MQCCKLLQPHPPAACNHCRLTSQSHSTVTGTTAVSSRGKGVLSHNPLGGRGIGLKRGTFHAGTGGVLRPNSFIRDVLKEYTIAASLEGVVVTCVPISKVPLLRAPVLRRRSPVSRSLATPSSTHQVSQVGGVRVGSTLASSSSLRVDHFMDALVGNGGCGCEASRELSSNRVGSGLSGRFRGRQELLVLLFTPNCLVEVPGIARGKVEYMALLFTLYSHFKLWVHV